MMNRYVIGVDFGSDSVRALVVDPADGTTIGSGVAFYPRWKQGLYQHPELSVFRQHPLDYLESLEACIKAAVSGLSDCQKASIVGIGVDTTGSTPVPVDEEGVPLSLKEEFAENENAMFFLWKDHAAAKEAEELNRVLRENCAGVDYTKFQGDYSAEWYWAKILYAVRNDRAVREAAYTWEEHSDWMVGVLCGETRPDKIYHSACAAGHKALWHSAWKGLPDAKVLESMDPYLVQVKERYGNAPQHAQVAAGHLCEEWAERLGLSCDVVISGSSFDAHAGAVGAGVKEGTMVCTLGTSAVDMIVTKPEVLEGKDIGRYCGQAENSIMPDCVGVETGQAAFGDIFAWFKRLMLWPIKQLEGSMDAESYQKLYRKMDDTILIELQRQAQQLPAYPFPIALDWFNGRRYPDTDDAQRAAINGLSLGMDAPYLYRSLVFGAVSGLYRLMEQFELKGVDIGEVVAVGGISKKSDYVMQMLSDLSGKEIKILEADQTCALGAAMYAAVASGQHESMNAASAAMASKTIRIYKPDPAQSAFYRQQYEKYLELAEAVRLK